MECKVKVVWLTVSVGGGNMPQSAFMVGIADSWLGKSGLKILHGAIARNTSPKGNAGGRYLNAANTNLMYYEDSKSQQFHLLHSVL